MDEQDDSNEFNRKAEGGQSSPEDLVDEESEQRPEPRSPKFVDWVSTSNTENLVDPGAPKSPEPREPNFQTFDRDRHLADARSKLTFSLVLLFAVVLLAGLAGVAFGYLTRQDVEPFVNPLATMVTAAIAFYFASKN